MDGKQVGKRPPLPWPLLQSCFYMRVPHCVNEVSFFISVGKGISKILYATLVKVPIQLYYSCKSREVWILKFTSVKSIILTFIK